MSFAISRDELASAFGPDHLVTIPADEASSLVTHPGTRRFLSEVGLPVVPGFLYEPEDCLESGLPPVASAEPEFGVLENLPDATGHWLVLGYCYSDVLYLDGSTGVLWARLVGDPRVTTGNSGIDRFARFLAAFTGAWDDFGEGTTLRHRERAAELLTATFRAVDAAAVSAPDGMWPRILDGLIHDYPA